MKSNLRKRQVISHIMFLIKILRKDNFKTTLAFEKDEMAVLSNISISKSNILNQDF